MVRDMHTYDAVWVSHSSMRDYLACPRAYYLRNVYKDPTSGRKVSMVTPALALGQAVHEVVESLSVMPTGTRLAIPLKERFEAVWKKVTGLKGGFFDQQTEQAFKERGRAMLAVIEADPGPITRLAVKISDPLPHYWLSPEEKIILCGKIDWLEYLPDTDSVHIIDFKTGKYEEEASSMQLPIYVLLTQHTQKRKVSGMSYWYLNRPAGLAPQPLPDVKEAEEAILKVAKKIKLARKLNKLVCLQGGCSHCKPYERIVHGEATWVGTNDFGQDLYVLPQEMGEQESVIL